MNDPVSLHLAFGTLIVGTVLATISLEHRKFTSALLTLGVSGVMAIGVAAIGWGISFLTHS